MSYYNMILAVQKSVNFYFDLFVFLISVRIILIIIGLVVVKSKF